MDSMVIMMTPSANAHSTLQVNTVTNCSAAIANDWIQQTVSDMIVMVITARLESG